MELQAVEVALASISFLSFSIGLVALILTRRQPSNLLQVEKKLKDEWGKKEDDLRKDNLRLQKEVEEVRSRLDAIPPLPASSSSKPVVSKEEHQALQKRVDALQKEYQDAHQRYQKDVESKLKTFSSQQQEELTKLRSHVTSQLSNLITSEQFSPLEEEVESLKEESKSLSNQLRSTQKITQLLSSSTKDLEDRLEQLTTTLTSLETSQSAALSRIGTLEEDFLDRQNRLAEPSISIEDSDDDSSDLESSEDEEEIDALLAEGSRVGSDLLVKTQTTPPQTTVVISASSSPEGTTSQLPTLYSASPPPPVIPRSATPPGLGSDETNTSIPWRSPDLIRRTPSGSQLEIRRSPIMLRRKKVSIDEETHSPPSLFSLSPSGDKRKEDSPVEAGAQTPSVPALNLAAIPGFNSPPPVLKPKQRKEEEGGITGLAGGSGFRTRSVSTNRTRPKSADEASIQPSGMSLHSGLLMTSAAASTSSTSRSSSTKLPIRQKIHFTEEELSSKKGKLRKVLEMIQEKEMMLLEKEKQLMLIEKEQMVSLYEIAAQELVICEEVGRGASAIVYRGFWNGTIVAIKALKKNNILNDNDSDQGFFREIELLSSLRHPNIIQYFGASITDDEVWMVVEFLPKGTLFELLHQSKDPLELSDIHKIARGIACGMAYLHTMSPPVIHLDLKSQNILLSPDLHPKVSDFGLSKLINEGGLRIGTPQWTAPEVFDAKDETSVTTKADVYSFGVVVNEMVSRRVPWRKHPRETIPILVNKKQLRPEIPESAPPAFVSLITDCWSHNPEDRPSFEEVLASLDASFESIASPQQEKKFLSRQASRKKRIQSVIGNYPISSYSFAPSFHSHFQSLAQTVKKNFDLCYEILQQDEIYNGVLEAKDLKSNEKVAVKKVEKSSANSDKDGNLSSLIIEDITMMKTFDHPNIIKLSDIYEDSSTIYLIMELLPLADELFMQLVDVGQYPEAYAHVIIKQVVKALDYLHAHSVAHGALRPENILCSGSGENVIVKLTNFGFSKLFEQERDVDGMAYQSPEVINSEADLIRPEPSMDIWSLGILTYALLSGLPPFCSDDLEELGVLINNVSYDFSDSDPWDSVSDLAKDFISKILVKDPSKRLTIQQCKSHPWIKTYKPERPAPLTARGHHAAVQSSSAHDPPLTTRKMEKEKEKDKMTFKENIEDFLTFGTELGVGAYSIVLRGEAKHSNDVYAVKCIDKKTLLSSEEGEDLLKFLKREIAIMKRVDHPNIIKLYDVYKNDTQFYLVLEYVPEAQELFEKVIQKGHYTEREAANVIRQVVLAIDYLHSNGIAHRDLKPENLMSSGDGENEVIKLMDFGFSKNYHGDSELRTAVGSPAYAAPELFEEVPSYDKSVDMWAVGVIAYVLLAGAPPFYGDTLLQLLEKVVNVDYEFDGEVWEEVSEDAKEFISQLLIKDPQQRLTARQCKTHPWLLEQM